MYIGGDFYIKEDYLRYVRTHILFTYVYTLYVLHLFVYLFVYLSFYLFIFLLVRILIFFSIFVHEINFFSIYGELEQKQNDKNDRLRSYRYH